MKKLNIFLLIIVFILGCKHLSREVKSMKIGKETAVKIANKEAKKMNYKIETMDILLDDTNTLWKRYSSSLNLDTAATLLDETPDIKRKLQNKDFWAVYYRPKNINQRGGDLWVFVDRNSGEVILYLRGQ